MHTCIQNNKKVKRTVNCNTVMKQKIFSNNGKLCKPLTVKCKPKIRLLCYCRVQSLAITFISLLIIDVNNLEDPKYLWYQYHGLNSQLYLLKTHDKILQVRRKKFYLLFKNIFETSVFLFIYLNPTISIVYKSINPFFIYLSV